jgi:hypothetical protein
MLVAVERVSSSVMSSERERASRFFCAFAHALVGPYCSSRTLISSCALSTSSAAFQLPTMSRWYSALLIASGSILIRNRYASLLRSHSVCAP